MANKLFKRQPETKTNEQLTQEIDDQLKKNRGGFLAEGFDSGTSNTPYRISDRTIANASGVEGYKRPSINTNANLADTNIVQIPKPQINNQSNDAINFIQQFTQSLAPQAQNQQEQQQIYSDTGLPFVVEQLQDQGVVYSDGVVRYPDGSIRNYVQRNATPIASLQDGSGEVYSDGSIRRYSSNLADFVTQDNISYINGGLRGLIYGIFGNNAQITQNYGNYNPGMGYANNIHRGTDIVSSSDFKLPVDAKVIESTPWDGQNPYGNSILVQLSSGEMLRFSHMADPSQYQAGEIIPAYSSFGQEGHTGNATGDHLDLEYYNANGQLADPSQFSGFAPTSQFKQEYLSKLPDLIKNTISNVSVMPKSDNQEQTQTPEQGQVLGEQTQQEQPQYSEVIRPEFQNTQISQDRSLGAKLNNLPEQASQISRGLSNKIERTQPTGKGIDFGVSEALRGDIPGALAVQKATLGNAKRKIGQEGQVLGASIERQQPTGQNIDLGISEALRGDFQGARDVQNATLGNIERKIQEGVGNAQTFVTDFLSNLKNDYLPQAGQGLVKTAYASSLNDRPQLSYMNSDFSPKIGDSPNSSMVTPLNIGETYQSRQSEGQADIRDPFFTTGKYQQYSSYLGDNPDQRAGGALDTSLFDKSFYERRNAEGDIKNVFSGTSMLPKAQKQFTDYRSKENQRALNEWRAKYSDPMFYNQDEVNKMYNQLVKQGSNSFIDVNSAPQPERHTPSIEDYFRIGKTLAQWYAETGNQAALDAQGGPEKAMQNYQAAQKSASGYNAPAPNVSPQSYQQSQQQVSQAMNPSGSNPNSLYLAGAPTQVQQNLGNVFGGEKISLPSSLAPASVQLPQQETWGSIFNKAKDLFTRIF